MNGLLILEDGSVYKGIGFGANATKVGELVFNTSMTGYQRMLTDPSYCGQILNLTYPLIGNYGISEVDYESDKIHAFGVVIRDLSIRPSNRMSVMTFSEWLEKMAIPAVHSVDTRDITMRIREHGSMKAIITTEDMTLADARKLMEETTLRDDYMKEVGCKEVTRFEGNGKKVAILDFGIKNGIIDRLRRRDCDITMYPYGTSAEEILSSNPDGIFLSNGPGDPSEAIEGVETVKELIGKKPIFGICMGHQILSMALGAQTYKLKFGHRGANHGVIDNALDKAFITSQNHSFAVDPVTVDQEHVEITHLNLNDGTVEGIRHRHLPLFSVQYHPEGSPGPNDNDYLFDQFIDLMGRK